MADKYDEAIAYLEANPDEIYTAWQCNFPLPQHTAHCLFQYTTRDGNPKELFTHRGSECGCLTQIRNTPQRYLCGLPELHDIIAQDERLPASIKDVRLEHLPVFAQYQRLLDQRLRSVPLDNGVVVGEVS